MNKFKLLFLSFQFLPILSFGQNFIAGTSYFSSNDYVEYIAGNLPIIISAPHGGNLKPTSIPDRNCNNCVYVKDSYTQELIREIQDAIHRETSCYPHIIINRLHRIKFDANRDIEDAADNNVTVENAWYAFHEFIDTAKNQVLQKFTKGLYIDLHGHGHDIQRIELGYLLSKSKLQLSNEILNEETYVQESSIQKLINNNVNTFTHSELLRGEKSLGTLLSEKNYPAVPSSNIAFPEDNEAYFRGGYNTRRHSKDDAISLDGIQIECNRDIRFDEAARKQFADSLAIILLDFIAIHYFPNFKEQYCQTVSTIELAHQDFHIFPNPTDQYLTIESNAIPFSIDIYNSIGQKIKQITFDSKNTNIDFTDWNCGIYFLQIKKGKHSFVRKVVKICR